MVQSDDGCNQSTDDEEDDLDNISPGNRLLTTPDGIGSREKGQAEDSVHNVIAITTTENRIQCFGTEEED